MSLSASPLNVEVPEARGWPRFCATIVAAIVAPAITTALLNMAAAVETLLSMPKFSAWPLDTLREVILAPVLGIEFGFLAALLFLAIGFYLAGRRVLTVGGYALAGATIGLIHSAAGLSLRGLGLLLMRRILLCGPRC